MSGENRDFDPRAFIGIGVCFMGSGVALSAALGRSGAGAVGISLIGLGVIFLLLGISKKRELESRDGQAGDEDRPDS